MKARKGSARGWQDVRIRYALEGEDGHAIVCCNGVGVSTFFWKYVREYFTPQHRVVTWDYRGHNRSGRPRKMVPENFTMTANAEDLRAVLDACEIDRAVLLGHSMGCQVLFEFWRLYPERVAGLVPICGAYGRPFDTAMNMGDVAKPVFDAFHGLTMTFPDAVSSVVRPLLRTPLPYHIGRLGMLNFQLASEEDMTPYFDHLAQMDLRVFFLMSAEMQKHSAEAWLHEIDAPTLVVAGEDDLLTPLPLSKKMAEAIPASEMLILPKGSHAGLIEHPELLNLRLDKFLRERVAPYVATRGKTGDENVA